MPDNIVPDSLITGTAADADFPLDNLKNISRSHSTRWTGQSPVIIEFTFPEALIDTVVIPYINISGAGTVQIIWSLNGVEKYNSNINNPNGLNTGGLIPIGVFIIGFHYWLQKDETYTSNGITDSAEPQIVDSVKIIITDDQAVNIDCKMILIGKKYTFEKNYNWGFNFQQIEKTIVKNSSGTHFFGKKTAIGRVIELPLNLSNTDANKLMELEKQHHEKAWWFDCMPWDDKLSDEFQLVGLVDNVKYTGQSYEGWTQQITVKEV